MEVKVEVGNGYDNEINGGSNNSDDGSGSGGNDNDSDYGGKSC